MFLVVLALISLLVVPVSAADTYQLRADTQLMTASDAIMPLIADSWYTSTSTDLDTIINWLKDIDTDTELIVSDVDSLYRLFNEFDNGWGFTTTNTLASQVYSMYRELDDLNTVLGTLSVTGNRSIGNIIYGMDMTLESIDRSVDAIADIDPNFILPAGYNYLRQDGVVMEYGGGNFGSLVRAGLAGIGSHLGVAAGSPVLLESGEAGTTTGYFLFSSMMRRGLLGLSANLKDISSGDYQTEIYDSSFGDLLKDPDGSIWAFDNPTMGSMLDTYLHYMQQDLGKLTFVYADPETIQAKKDAQENEDAAVDGFLDPDSPGSISASDIGSAADAVGSTKELFDTGVSPDQAFEQLSGAGPLEFFTSVTAANLDTVPATVSEEDDDFIHFYDPSNSEFFELIGKGG